MKPTIKTDRYKLYLGDCLEVLPQLKSASVDAVVTDPPYNVKFKYDGDDSKDNKSDYGSWCSEWFLHLRRVCKGCIAISTGTNNLSWWAANFPPDWWYAWYKPATMGRCLAGFCNWEPIAFYGKPHRTGVDVITATIRPDASLSWHPCPKPLAWASRQLQMFCKPGGIVLDPFMGSGTVGVAAVQSGRRFIGIEQHDTYTQKAGERIAKAKPRLSMLDILEQSK